MNRNSLHRPLTAAGRLLLIAGLMLTLASTPSAHAASFTVDTRGDAVDASPGDGLCATVEGRCTLRAAILETNALPGADTIILPAGSYVLSIPGAGEDAAATGDLDITDDLTITGAGMLQTGIYGKGRVTGDRAFHIPGSAVVTISGVTIGHGRAVNGGGIYNSGTLTLEGTRLYGNTAVENSLPGEGGGIYNSGTLTLNRSILSGNSAESTDLFGSLGGGISSSGKLTLGGSRLHGNTADYGGGIYNTGTLTVTHSPLSGNAGFIGGGIYNSGALIVTHSMLTGNSADFAGGIYNSQGTVMVSHSTLSGNSAEIYGGGISSYSFTFTLSHSSLSANTAVSAGGGIYNYYTNFTVRHSTLTGNSARFNGGGIFNSYGALTLQSAILAENTAATGPDCFAEELDSAGYNLLGNDSGCNFIPTEGDLIGTPDDPIDPLLGPLQDNGGPTFTHALLEGSPAIDAGNPDECPPEDQRGFPRPIDGDGNGSAICDIGSYEYGSAP